MGPAPSKSAERLVRHRVREIFQQRESLTYAASVSEGVGSNNDRTISLTLVKTLLSHAGGAEPVQRHGVFLDPKLRGSQLTQIVQASGDVESSIALLALKMVVVTLVGALVARGLSWNFDRFDPTIIQKKRNRPIDGRHA
jgi:hypothetical protein